MFIFLLQTVFSCDRMCSLTTATFEKTHLLDDIARIPHRVDLVRRVQCRTVQQDGAALLVHRQVDHLLLAGLKDIAAQARLSKQFYLHGKRDRPTWQKRRAYLQVALPGVVGLVALEGLIGLSFPFYPF